jgi:uncharacterized membrane protein
MFTFPCDTLASNVAAPLVAPQTLGTIGAITIDANSGMNVAQVTRDRRASLNLNVGAYHVVIVNVQGALTFNSRLGLSDSATPDHVL